MLTAETFGDTTKYQPKIVLGLTTRMLVCLTLYTVFVMLWAAYFWFFQRIEFSDCSLVCLIAALPLLLIGFVRPFDMDFEEFLPYFMRHNFGTAELLYENRMREGRTAWASVHDGLADAEKNPAWSWARKRRGVERWCICGQQESDM